MHFTLYICILHSIYACSTGTALHCLFLLLEIIACTPSVFRSARIHRTAVALQAVQHLTSACGSIAVTVCDRERRLIEEMLTMGDACVVAGMKLLKSRRLKATCEEQLSPTHD